MSTNCDARLSFLDIAGTPYDVGRALGRFGKRAVHEHIRHTPAWANVMNLRNDPRMTTMAAAVAAQFPRHRAELQGLADGLDLPFEDVFAWNCRGDLWALAPDGCTTVQIPGKTVHCIAHNEDGDPGLVGRCALARLDVEGRSPFTSFLYPGSLPGHTFAATDAGLVQTVNNIRALNGGPGVPRMVLTRALLDTYDLDGAIALIRETTSAGAFHLTLAQAGDPRLLSVEFTATRKSVTEIGAPSLHTNHLIHDDLAPVPQIVTGSSRARKTRGDLLIAGQRQRDDLDPLAILWDTGVPELPIYRTDPDDPDTENTLASAVFSVGTQHVDWCVYDRRDRSPRFTIREGLAPVAT